MKIIDMTGKKFGRLTVIKFEFISMADFFNMSLSGMHSAINKTKWKHI